jgi:alkylation response protein AidB-like acyl-CoA dehydrogenase
VDFRLNEDQEALKKGVRDWADGELAIERLRGLEGKPLDRALWTTIAELGVFALRTPESAGGSGLGAADAVLVFEELGRKVAPGPLVATHLATGLGIDGAGSGQTVVGLIEPGPSPLLVAHKASLDVLLVLRPDGVERLDPKALPSKPISTPLDPLTPVERVESLPRGERIADAASAQETMRIGTALVAAELLGIAQATLDLALDYAKVREQFGRPIGSFQAIKHLLADMYVRLEVARAGVYAAGATIDQPEVGDVERAVAAAKLVAHQAAEKNARAAIQIHGGMGYTWEVPVHYYLKRAWVLGTSFGAQETHEEAVARALVTGT